MTRNRGADGWAGLVDDDDLVEEPEKPTDPTPRRTAPPSRGTVDPVLAAMQELDGPNAVPPRSARRTAAPSPRMSRSAQNAPGRPSLSLPRPDAKPAAGGQTPRLSLPIPDKAPGTPTPRPSAAPDFDHEALIDKINEKDEPKPKKAIWPEYKEVIITGIGALCLTAGFGIYTALQPDEVPEKPSPTTARQTAVHQIDAARKKRASRVAKGAIPEAQTPKPRRVGAKSVPPPDTAKAKAPAVKKAAVPMLSIVSDPPGAMVEVAGELYGKTPLIKAFKPPDDPLGVRIRLKLSTHSPWEAYVKPNAAGHYVVQAKLRKN